MLRTLGRLKSLPPMPRKQGSSSFLRSPFLCTRLILNLWCRTTRRKKKYCVYHDQYFFSFTFSSVGTLRGMRQHWTCCAKVKSLFSTAAVSNREFNWLLVHSILMLRLLLLLPLLQVCFCFYFCNAKKLQSHKILPAKQ